jgi:hypothetical protein
MSLSLDEVLVLLKTNPTPDLLERVNDARTPLLEAINEKRQDDIDYLLAQKANVHARHEGDSAIIMACQQNNPELVIQLVNCGANVDEWNRQHMTPAARTLTSWSTSVSSMARAASRGTSETSRAGRFNVGPTAAAGVGSRRSLALIHVRTCCTTGSRAIRNSAGV